MKRVSFYFKESFIANMYLVLFALIDLGVLCIGDELMWLKTALCGVCLAGFMFIVGLMFYKEGESAAKVLRGNDMNREQIIKTGREYPINLAEEYKPWKGFLIGFLSSCPVILFMIIHAIVSPLGPLNNGGGVAAAFLYMVVFSFFRVNSKADILTSDYYYTLIIIPVMVLSIGIGYIIGAKKEMRAHQKIVDKHNAIHGGK